MKPRIEQMVKRGSVPSQRLDCKPASDQDEAKFADYFYREEWVFDQYQQDRIRLFEMYLFPLKLPDGYVVMFGTHNGSVFRTWNQNWGTERCLGFELYNETEMDNIVTMDVRGLGNWCSTPIALCWNDIGSWDRTPQARRSSYEWIKKNVVLGGFYLERGDDIAGWSLSYDMERSGYEIVQSMIDGAYVLYRKISN